ncbi:MAG: PAS domain-containing protein, partial [bacterium]
MFDRHGSTKSNLKRWRTILNKEETHAGVEEIEACCKKKPAVYPQGIELFRLQSAALESAANAVVITDRAGHITWVNRAFTHLTGYESDEVVGQKPNLLKSGEHEPSFYQNLWHTILNGKAWRGEIINRRKNGSLYTEEQTITPVSNGAGEV